MLSDRKNENICINNSGWYGLKTIIGGQFSRLSFALLFTAFAVVAELSQYYIIFNAIQLLLTHPVNINVSLLILAGWFAFVLFLKNIFYSGAYFLSHQATFSILLKTRRSLVERLTWASLYWLQQHNSGQLKQSIIQDVENIEMFISHHTVEVFAAVLSPLVVITYLFYIDWRLAMAALICVPLALSMSTLFMRDMGKQYDDFNRASSELNSATVEYLRNMPVMKVFQQDTKNFLLMKGRLDKYYGLVAELTKKTVPGWALFSSFLGANILFILPVSIWLYSESIVALEQVILVIILGAGMLKPWMKISRFLMEINEILAGVRNLMPILDIHKPEKSTTYDIINLAIIYFA